MFFEGSVRAAIDQARQQHLPIAVFCSSRREEFDKFKERLDEFASVCVCVLLIEGTQDYLQFQQTLQASKLPAIYILDATSMQQLFVLHGDSVSVEDFVSKIKLLKELATHMISQFQQMLQSSTTQEPTPSTLPPPSFAPEHPAQQSVTVAQEEEENREDNDIYADEQPVPSQTTTTPMVLTNSQPITQQQDNSSSNQEAAENQAAKLREISEVKKRMKQRMQKFREKPTTQQEQSLQSNAVDVQKRPNSLVDDFEVTKRATPSVTSRAERKRRQELLEKIKANKREKEIDSTLMSTPISNTGQMLDEHKTDLVENPAAEAEAISPIPILEQVEANRQEEQQQRLENKGHEQSSNKQLLKRQEEECITSTIGFKLPDGTMLRNSFSVQSTIGDLKSFVNANAVINQHYVLRSTYPKRSYETSSETLAQCNLVSNAILLVTPTGENLDDTQLTNTAENSTGWTRIFAHLFCGLFGKIFGTSGTSGNNSADQQIIEQPTQQHPTTHSSQSQ